MSQEFYTGQRLQVDKQRATARYVGPVEGQDGVWVGLDWDNPQRGKHDGSHNGTRYFCTQGGAKSGSFVKTAILLAIADMGCTLLEALRKKYEINQQDAGSQSGAVTISGKAVQLVGLEKLQRQRGGIDRLEEVALLDASVSSAGDPGQLHAAAPCICDLDLSSNLLGQWSQVERLCQELPLMHTLNLSQNVLSPTQEATTMKFQSLRRLILNQTRMSFSQACSLLTTFPSLEELHLCNNSIADLTFDPAACSQLASLKVISLEDNDLCTWEEVLKLQSLPSLERLLLSGNSISSIQFPTTAGESSPFPSLTSLTLGNNRLSSWESVDALHCFPRLSAVRLGGNPCPGDDPGHRFQVIARIGKLTSLNGSTVSASERKDCEVQYMREVLGQRHAPAPASASNTCTRVQELQLRYGDVGIAAIPATAPKALGAGMLQVQLTCRAASPAAGSKLVSKRLPGSLTVGKLKLLIQRLYKIPASRQLLKLTSDDSSEDVTSLDNRELNFFASQGPMTIDIFDNALSSMSAVVL